MTIYDIKRLTAETDPYFFSRKAMRFAGQTLKSFKVRRYGKKYIFRAPLYAPNCRRIIGETVKLFNPTTNKIETAPAGA
jgi:hypothetical protein